MQVFFHDFGLEIHFIVYRTYEEVGWETTSKKNLLAYLALPPRLASSIRRKRAFRPPVIVDSPAMEPLSAKEMLCFKKVKRILGVDPCTNPVHLCFVHPAAEMVERPKRDFVGMKQLQSRTLARTTFRDKQLNIAG